MSYDFSYLLTGIPSRFIRNFEKFHLMKLPKVPSTFDFRYLYNGWAPSPFTLILLNISNLILYCLTNSLISASGLGSFNVIKIIRYWIFSNLKVTKKIFIFNAFFHITNLATKLIAWKSKHTQTLRLIFCIKVLHFWIISGCEATRTRNT